MIGSRNLPGFMRDERVQSKPKVPRRRRIAKAGRSASLGMNNFIRVETNQLGSTKSSENFPEQSICLDLCFDASRGKKVILRGRFWLLLRGTGLTLVDCPSGRRWPLVTGYFPSGSLTY